MRALRALDVMLLVGAATASGCCSQSREPREVPDPHRVGQVATRLKTAAFTGSVDTDQITHAIGARSDELLEAAILLLPSKQPIGLVRVRVEREVELASFSSLGSFAKHVILVLTAEPTIVDLPEEDLPEAARHAFDLRALPEDIRCAEIERELIRSRAGFIAACLALLRKPCHLEPPAVGDDSELEVKGKRLSHRRLPGVFICWNETGTASVLVRDR